MAFRLELPACLGDAVYLVESTIESQISVPGSVYSMYLTSVLHNVHFCFSRICLVRAYLAGYRSFQQGGSLSVHVKLGLLSRS